MLHASLLDRLRAALADRYTVQREIGAGGMATVYLAEDLKHHRPVAIKVLDPDLAAAVGADRFLREIETAANLTHPHILPLHDSGEVGGLVYYVMPYVEGESLRERLQRDGQLAVDDALRITREIADALAYAHERGVIHRDVKPANILLEAGHAVLADFGVAQAVTDADEARLTATGVSLGTPSYMSPEQAAGERDLDGRSDQYALGCVLYEMLAGQPPFTGKRAESVVRQHLVSDPTPITEIRATVSEAVEAALGKSLAKAPADRFGTTGEFGRVLDAQLHTPATGTAAAPGAVKGNGRLAGLVAAAAVVSGLLVWQPWASEEQAAANSGPPPWTILADVEGSASAEIRSPVWGLLSSEIGRSGAVMALSQGQMSLGLASAMKPDTTRITEALARELAVRGNVQTVMVPVLDRIGSTYALSVRASTAEHDSTLIVAVSSAAGQDELISAVRVVVDTLAAGLAGRFGTVLRTNEGAITPSFEAFQRNSAGVELYNQGRYREAIALSKEAIRVDPDFAMAWIQMGLQYQVIGLPDSARWAINQGLARPERIKGLFAQYVDLWQRPDGDPQELYHLAERMVRENPSDGRYNSLAVALNGIGRHDEAVATLEELEARSPFGLNESRASNLVAWLNRIGRFDEARVRAAHLASGSRRTRFEGQIAASAAEWDEAEEKSLGLLRSPEATPGERRGAQGVRAYVHAARGKVRSSLDALRERGEQALPLGSRQDWSVFLLTLSVAGDTVPENLGLSSMLSDTTKAGQELAGLWSLHRGQLDAARELAATLVEPDPDDPSLIAGVDAGRILLFARVAAAEEDWGAAIELLTSQIGPDPWTTWTVYRQLAEWTVADAFEKLGRADSAAVHFDRLANPVDERSFQWALQWRGLTHSFAHRRAALLYGQLGNTDKALEHWRVFLADFTEPDPEYEWMVTEAREELARLEG